MNVQAEVETPWIYLLANCQDTVAEKYSFSEERRVDILEMVEPLEIDGVKLHDKLRFFQGFLFLRS